MGLAQRMKTAGKVEILEGTKKEAELLYLHNIVAIVEEHEIPSNLIMNLDQTPLKYLPVSHHTMAKKEPKSVSIAGSTDKRCITDFLPLQVIYGDKITDIYPDLNFLNLFH